MPLEMRTGSRVIPARELALPPPYAPVRMREFGDAFAHARALAPERGAGTLVYVGRFDLAEFALVLEPEEKLAQARRAFYACMAALADALGALAEPETVINIDWPDTLTVNFGLVGGGRLAWPVAAAEDEVPPWLVFGGMIRTASTTGSEPGAKPEMTALEEEGFGATLSSHVVESFARNFMLALDAWKENGFGAVAKSYLQYLPSEQGLRRAIDDNGDLLLRRMAAGDIERLALLPRLAAPAWYDAKAKSPRA
jgi:biotin-(acetyl-CoA carboxylase) ligase